MGLIVKQHKSDKEITSHYKEPGTAPFSAPTDYRLTFQNIFMDNLKSFQTL